MDERVKERIGQAEKDLTIARRNAKGIVDKAGSLGYDDPWVRNSVSRLSRLVSDVAVRLHKLVGMMEGLDEIGRI